MINKCDCYCTGERTLYDYMGFKTYTEPYGYCNGTRERDLCSCGGDRTKCNFYPEVREKALKEQLPKFGEWISVKDRLPEKDTRVLCYYKYEPDSPDVICENTYGIKHWLSDESKVTHWMPLPALPKGE